MAQFRPNLAAKLKAEQTYEDVLPTLPWENGIYVSPKLDGIRVIMHANYGPVTRSLKPIPNRALRKYCEDNFSLLKGLDGEFVWGNHESPDYSFQKTFSKFSTHGESNIELMSFHVFDKVCDGAFEDRIAYYKTQVANNCSEFEIPGFLRNVPQHPIYTLKQALWLEEKYLNSGYEGIMLRKREGLYKEGRSTMREAGLVALKRVKDAEAVIIGFEELMHNDNKAKTNELGYTERSSALAGKVPGNTLGKFIVKGHHTSPFAEVEFKIGSGVGLTQELRKEIWDNQAKYLGKIVTHKYQDHGIKDKPRQPIFKSFREDLE